MKLTPTVVYVTKHLVQNAVTGKYYRRGEHFCVAPMNVVTATLVDDQELAVLNATYENIRAIPVTVEIPVASDPVVDRATV